MSKTGFIASRVLAWFVAITLFLAALSFAFGVFSLPLTVVLYAIPLVYLVLNPSHFEWWPKYVDYHVERDLINRTRELNDRKNTLMEKLESARVPLKAQEERRDALLRAIDELTEEFKRLGLNIDDERVKK